MVSTLLLSPPTLLRYQFSLEVLVGHMIYLIEVIDVTAHIDGSFSGGVQKVQKGAAEISR